MTAAAPHKADRLKNAAAIRSHLLADLALWPATFQRRLRPVVERRTTTRRGARRELVMFQYHREAWPLESHLFYGALGAWIHGIREAATRRRRSGSPDRTELEREKADLLDLFWQFGQRRMDRRELREHALRFAQTKVADLELQATVFESGEFAGLRAWFELLERALRLGTSQRV